MAETIAISLQVDSGQSVNKIKEVEKEISILIDETNELNQINSEFKRELQNLTDTYSKLPNSALSAKKQLKTQIDDLKVSIKDNNLALQELRIEKQQKAKLIADFKTIKKESAETAKNLTNIATGMAHGYQAFLGVSALVGNENEDLMKTLVKLQGIQSTLSAVEKIRNDLTKQSTFLISLQSTGLKIMTGLQKAYSLAVGVSTKAMKGLKVALLSIGIGAIIVALGAIIAYWEDIKGAVSGLSKEQKKINLDLEKEKELTQANLDNISDTENTLRLAGKSEEDILKMKLEQLDVQIEQQQQTIENAKLQKKTQVEASERNRNILQGIIRFLSLPLTLLLKTVDILTASLSKIPGIDIETNLEEGFSNGVAKMIFDPEEVAKQSEDTIAEAEKGLAELQNKRDGFTLDEQKKNRANWEKRKSELEKQREEELRIEAEKQAKILEMQRDFEDLLIANIEDESARKIAQLQLQQERELQALRDKYGAETLLEKELLIKQNNELQQTLRDIANENRAKEDETNAYWEGYDKEKRKEKALANLEEIKLNDKQQLDLLKTKFENGLMTEQEYADSVNAILQAQNQNRLDNLNAVGDVLGGLSSLFAESEKAQKAFALAQIAVDTAKAISSLVANSQANPLNAVTAGGAGISQFASGIAQILTNIGRAKQLLQGGSGVSAPSRSSAPRSSGGENTTTTTLDRSGGSASGNNRVYLVESELQAMQNRRMNTELISVI